MNYFDEELDETIEPDDISIGSDNSELDKLYDDFNEGYPIEKLKSLTIEEYTNLKEISEDYFCTWVERRAQKLGSIQGATSLKFGIYKINELPKIKCIVDDVNKYAWPKRYGKDNEDHTHYKVVFEQVKQSLVEVAEAAQKDAIDFTTIDNSPLAPMFKWKVAFLYSNQRLLPVYSPDALKYLAQEKGFTLNKKTKISEIILFLLSLKESTNIWDYSRSLWQLWDARSKDAYNDFPVERWLGLFNEPDVFTEISMEVLKKILELGGKATCKQLADKYGDTPTHYNGICTKLAGRIARRLGLVLEKRTSGSETRWKILFDGQKVESGSEVPGNFTWILKPNLKIALEQIGKIKPEEVKMIEEMTKILNLKKNIILQGAPGTGKTYRTAELALSVIGELPSRNAGEDEKLFHKRVMDAYDAKIIKLNKDGSFVNPNAQIGFVTFHQSMDYEDFVEGIKPIKPDEGEMYYKVEDGFFKVMSRVATNPQQVKQEKTLNSAFDDLIQDIIDGNVKNLPMKNGSSSADLSVSSQLTIKWKAGNGNIDANCVSKDRLLKLCEVYDSKEKLEAITNINESIRNIIGGCNSSYYWAVANYILEKIGKGIISYEKIQNYVLIIDEINRGNVSKIFGELISLLEADKRVGGDHPLSVTLPYTKDPFSVPSNLFIIGTMNTTDRSVGSIDYAVRRRFAFVTLKADESAIENYYKGKDESLKNKAVELFGKVKDILSNKDNRSNDMEFDDLMVGHSYFMAETLEELDLKWKYEVIPLLKEYQKDGLLRHSIDIENALKEEIQETEV